MINQGYPNRKNWFSERFLNTRATPETSGRAPGQAESPQQREANEARNESIQERMGYQDALRAHAEYRRLKGDTNMQEAMRQANVARASGETLSPAEEREVAEYNQKIVEQLRIMESALTRKAAETLPKGFNRDQMLDEVFKIADQWGLKEAEADLARYFGSRDAMLTVLKEQLGDDFNNLSAADQIRRAAEVGGIKNIPPELKRHLRTMGLDMPEGLTFGPIQSLGERLASNSSLAKGSFLAKAGGNLAQTIVTTGILANVIGPLFGMSLSVMKNITNPREMVKEVKQQVSNIKPSQMAKVFAGLGGAALFSAAAMTNKPITEVGKDVRDTVVGFGGSAINTVGETAGNLWERATGRTPSHRLVNMLKANTENQDFFEANEGKNGDILRRFYSAPDTEFDLESLNDIRNQRHLEQLASFAINTENLPSEAKSLYETGRQRLEAAREFFSSTSELASRFGMSAANIEIIKIGNLAELLNSKYLLILEEGRREEGKRVEGNFLTGFTDRVANIYETEAEPTVSSAWRGASRTVRNVFNIVVNDIIRDEPVYTPVVDRYRNVQRVQETEEALPPPSLVPAPAELRGVGFQVENSWESISPYVEEAPQIFAALLAHARRIQNPRAFRRTAQ
jgi:hypothetical protein